MHISFKQRILLGFFSLIAMMGVIIAISLFQFNKARISSTELNEHLLPIALTAQTMALDILQVQQFLTDVSATHNKDSFIEAETYANDFKRQAAGLQAMPALSDGKKAELVKINTAFDTYYAVGKKMGTVYIEQGIEAGNVMMAEFDAAAEQLTQAMVRFRDDAIERETQTVHELSEGTTSATQNIIIASVLIIIASVLISYYLTRYLYLQLGIDPFYAKGIAKEIAKGNFSRDIQTEPGDKDSLLFAIKQIQQSINDFVAALEDMMKKHDEGWIWETIDASKYPGTYGRLAKDINGLVKSHIDVKMQVVEVISHYAKGDFTMDMPRLPGDKAKITQAIDDVKKILIEVSTEIDMLASCGAKGDFSKRADSSRFEHMFKEIINDFNSLVETCDTGFNEIIGVTHSMSLGDLTHTIDKDYPGTFGRVISGINATGEHLKSLVSDIKTATYTINTAAKEIASGNNDLSHRTEEQAASLEQTAASMEELTSTVQANTEHAKQANVLARNAAEIADKGVTVMGEVVKTMESINESSNKIVDIISVIDSIAFQTNILALNAAVEAARAGEQGRGFAVVASEVRNLAQRAALAAGEIKTLIGDSVEKVEDGSKLVLNAGSTMEEIVNSIRRVTSIMNEIAAASVEQTSGIQQVNQAIAQMDDATQQNAALVEQAAAAAESLEEQANNLSATVEQFKVEQHASKTASYTPSATPKLAAPATKIQTYKGKAAPVAQRADADEWEEF